MRHKNLPGISLRILILLFLSLLLTYWFFSYFKEATSHISIFTKEISYSTLPVSIDRILEDISPIVKIPLPIMRFDAYARNNVINKNDRMSTQPTSTNLNVNILGNYVIVPTGETRLLKDDIYFYPGFTLDYSMDPKDPNGFYDGIFEIYFEPTILTLFLVWFFFAIPVVYAFIAIFAYCIKFILTGLPFTGIEQTFTK